MADFDKKSLSERDICTKFITPAVKKAGWDELLQIREEVSFTKGRIIVRGKLVTRGKAKRADYILHYKPNIPIALIEAKDNSYPVGGGMQQALEYAATLDIPFVFYLRNVNVRWFDFDLSDVFEMPFEDDELEECVLHSGDVLVCEGGEPGRTAVWDERERQIYFQKAIHRVRFPRGASPYFFANALRESADSGRLARYFTGVGIKHFTGKGLASFVFPLLPLAEQRRIVAKVEELMDLCDRLEAQLSSTQTESCRLLEVVLHEALAT